MKGRLFFSKTFDPWLNLAIEDWLFRNIELSSDEQILYLWRNDPTVVIGRFQNPWSECHLEKMELDQIKLARRQSGGGAVYQDHGNTNFTFISSRDAYDKEANHKIIEKALQRFQIKARTSGRNDMVIDTEDGELKFSGSAFKENRDRCFHHGTLLINADLGQLGNYLNPAKKKLQSKGIKSVRARVTNLCEWNDSVEHDKLCQKIVEEFQNYYGFGPMDAEYIDHKFCEQKPALQKKYQELKEWDWRFGECPVFQQELNERLSFGSIELFIDTKNAKVRKCELFSDTLDVQLITILKEGLVDLKLESSFILERFSFVEAKYPEFEKQIREFSSWLDKSTK